MGIKNDFEMTNINVNLEDVSEVIRASAQSEWGILALFLLVILGFAYISYPAFKGSQARIISFIIFTLLGAALLVVNNQFNREALKNPPSYLKEIPGNVHWKNMDVFIEAGDRFNIQVVGKIQFSSRADAPGSGYSGPNGVPMLSNGKKMILLDLHHTKVGIMQQ